MPRMKFLSGVRLLAAAGLTIAFSPPLAAQGAFPSPTPYGSAIPDQGNVPAAPAPVNPDAVFDVDGVAVDVTAASAAAARDKAIFDGQRTALGTLLERLDAKRAADPAKLSDNKIAGMVRNFEITSEKSSSVRYIATMNVRFKPTAIQKLLGNAGIAYNPPTLPTVLLPVSDSNGRAVLWEESTPWRTALEALEQQGGQTVTVPSGELNDVSAIDANAATNGDALALGSIATLHGAGNVVVARLAGEVNAGQPLNIALARYDAHGQRLEGQTLIIPPASDANAQLHDAATRVQEFVLHKALVTTASAVPTAQNSMPLYAPLSSLPELTRLRQRLGGISAIQRINIQSVSREGAEITLDYNGDASQLQQAITQQGLSLLPSPTGQWLIRSN